MGFAEIVGHAGPTRLFQRSLAADTMAGCYLLEGPQSVGKTTLAMAVAQAASCLNPLEDPYEACGECSSCRLVASHSQPEVVLIPPAGDSTQIWQFWDRDGRPPGALQHALQFAPAVGRRRVIIIERADTLTEGAANSLLKSLEEPPSYVLFLLLTQSIARVLPTVVSRSQCVRLLPVPRSAIEARLVSLGVDPFHASMTASVCQGRPGLAFALAEQDSKEAETVVRFTLEMLRSSLLDAPRLSEALRKMAVVRKIADVPIASTVETAAGDDEGSEAAPRDKAARSTVGGFVEGMMDVLRDIFRLRVTGADADITYAGCRTELQAMSELRTPGEWMAALTLLDTARRRLDQNAGIGLVTDWMVAELIAA